MRRREALVAAGAGLAALVGGLPRAHAVGGQLRIGFQKYGTLVLLKERGTLEKRLSRQGYTRHLDRVPGRSAAARGAERRRHRFRHHRRGAADLRPGRGRRPALCRLRAAGARRARRSSCPRTRRSPSVADLKGRKVALNKGSNVHYLLVRALEAAGLEIQRHRARLPAAGRRPRGVRARRGRRLGDLGPVPGRRPGRDGRPHAGRRHRAGRQPPVLPRLARLRGRASRDAVQAIIEELDAVDRWAAGNRRRWRSLLGAARRHPGPGAPGGARAHGLRRAAGHRRACVAEQQRIADTFHDLGLLPEADHGPRRRLEGQPHEAPSGRAADILWFIPTHGDGRYLGTSHGAREVDLRLPAPDRPGGRRARLLRRAAADRAVSCEDSWVVASALVAADPAAALPRRRAARACTTPSVAARMAATLDRISGGRLLINVVTGGDPVELKGDGLFLDHAERYEVTAEFLRVWRAAAGAARRSTSRAST